MPLSNLPTHTSASALGCYALCPRKFEHRYVLKTEPEYRSTGLALGTAVHGAVAWWFTEKIEQRTPTLGDALKILEADLSAALAYPGVKWKGDTHESLLADAEKLLRLFVEKYGELPVVETEVRFDMPVVDPDTGETMPRPCIGYFDLELHDGTISELKTAQRAYSATDLRVNLQFACYRTAARYFGDINVDVLALIKTKVPKVQHVELHPDRAVATWFMRAAAAIERGIAAGIFPPSPGPMCGSCEYGQACLGVEAGDVDAEAA